MSIVDIIILIFLALGVLIGFKRGFTRQLVSLVGIFVIITLSFIFKNPVSVFLYNNLPFFNFGGIFKDITVLNILVYEAIAFFIVFFVLTIIFKILVKLTKWFEKLLNATIILGIPSKILGAVLGVVQNIIYTFIILYILSLPTFNLSIINDSKVGNLILYKTPILNKIANKTLSVFNQVVELKEEYDATTNVGEYNQKTLNIMINSGVITKVNAKKLIKKGKIKGVTIE
ncbi:MAG: CvpA family protein [Bacilli bacterium]|nr:CvpA family protein [Bacilli bacterium]